MVNYSFFDNLDQNKIVNVASVPKRSPFRYPGGKTWLVPSVRKWIAHYDIKPKFFFEPFTGGGIIGLTIAFERLAEKVILIELDDGVASVWKTILSDDNQWLVDKIINFTLTPETAEFELNKQISSVRDKAFQTLLKNRIFHGGILAPGSGLIKVGEGGKGILSRWYPKTIGRRIVDIGNIRERFEFIQGDGIEFIRDHVGQSDAIFFIDPPYTAGGKKAGSRLYNHYLVDHEAIFNYASQFKNDFLMTYDNAEEVHSLANKYNFDTYPIAMNNTHHAKITELLIARDLQWARKSIISESNLNISIL